MKRLFMGLGYVAMAVMNYLTLILIWIGSLAAGILLATMLFIATGSIEARRLTLFNWAAWCPFVAPEGSAFEQYLWLACLFGGIVAAQYLTAWLFFPKEEYPRPTQAERDLNNIWFLIPRLIVVSIARIIGRSIINLCRKILRHIKPLHIR